MNRSDCGEVERYGALVAPTCMGGSGCDGCREKFRNPPVYSLPWLKQYRKPVVQKMWGLAKSSKEPATLTRKRARLARLAKQVEELSAAVRNGCQHLVENQKYSERGREDTLGNYKSGSDNTIQCQGCGEILARWTD